MAVELGRLRSENERLTEQVSRPRSLTELVLATDLEPEFFRRLATYLLLDKKAWDEFMARCKVISGAKLYGHKSPDTVAAAALKGMDMGMGFMESLDKIKVIHGTPTIRGPKAKALIDARVPENRNECTESTDTRCVWVMRPPGREEKEFVLTFEEVKHLAAKNDLWKTYRRRMLKWNCFSEGAQEIYGHVLGDLYLTEELDGSPDAKSARRAPSKPRAPTKKNGLNDDQRDGLNKALHRAALQMNPDWPTQISEDDQDQFRDTRKFVYENACQATLEFVPDAITTDQASLVQAHLNARADRWEKVLAAVQQNIEGAAPSDPDSARRELWNAAWKAEAGDDPEPKTLAAADAALADKILAGLAKNLERIEAEKKDGEETKA